MRKKEEVEVKYCDICGAREDDLHTILTCWSCGKEACSQHYHLVSTENKRRHTYLCEDCDRKMESKLDVLFEQFSEHHKNVANDSIHSTSKNAGE